MYFQPKSVNRDSVSAVPINLNVTGHGEENGIHYHQRMRLASYLSELDGARNDVHSSAYHPFAPRADLPPHFLGDCVGGITLPRLFICSHEKAKVFACLHPIK